MSVAQRLPAGTPTRRWAGMGAVALGWVALYEVNLPLWDWVVYDLGGLAPGSRLPRTAPNGEATRAATSHPRGEDHRSVHPYRRGATNGGEPGMTG